MSPDVLPKHLSASQREVVALAGEAGASLFVRGLPGTGKTTALMARLAALLAMQRRPHEILVLLPQRAHVQRWERMVALLGVPTPGGVDHVTFYSLSRRAVALFWPLIAREVGFARPDMEPTFLTLETAQYYMWRIVEPLIAHDGYFSDIVIRRGRLLSQLIDNLNKAAVVGFSHTDIYARLRAAWTGTPDRLHSYLQAQDCAIRFRNYCLAHNLLDFSLVTEAFHRHLFVHEAYQRYFRARYRHLLVDNAEEGVPVEHELIRWAIHQCDSAVIACDEGAGYRVFLGADARGARELAVECRSALVFPTPVQPNAPALAFANAVRRALRIDGATVSVDSDPARAILGMSEQDGRPACRYWISMIRDVSSRVAELVQGGTPPGDIAILAPYVSELMRFAMSEELAARGVALRLLRPAMSLGEDPVVRALLTLVLLAHPNWPLALRDELRSLPVEDVALALQTALAGLDPIRARLLARAAYAFDEHTLADLAGQAPRGQNTSDLARLWEAVGYQVRPHYQRLREWLVACGGEPAEPVDLFVSRLFADLLCRPGYGFHVDADKARACGRLVESAFKFRQAVQLDGELTDAEVARQYVELVLGGVASAEYLLDWATWPEDAVILAPAYAYLTRDMRSSYQFWLDIGSDGWWNRPRQPLTNAYVLSRNWPPGQPWRDVEEDRSKRETLGQIVEGLAARCTRGIYLAYSELGIDGEQQSGPLQRAISRALAGAAVHD